MPVFPNLFCLVYPLSLFVIPWVPPMLMILKKYNVTQVIIKCFHVPPAVCLRTPRGTRTPGWESLIYAIIHPSIHPSIYQYVYRLSIHPSIHLSIHDAKGKGWPVLAVPCHFLWEEPHLPEWVPLLWKDLEVSLGQLHGWQCLQLQVRQVCRNFTSFRKVYRPSRSFP